MLKEKKTDLKIYKKHSFIYYSIINNFTEGINLLENYGFELTKEEKKNINMSLIIKTNDLTNLKVLRYIFLKDEKKKNLKKLLQVIIKNENLEALEFLKSKNIDLNQKLKNNDTFLHFAIRNDKNKILNKLIENNQNLLEQKNCKNKTCFHLAAEIGNIKGMDILLKNGIQIDDSNDLQKTALTFAFEKNQFESVKFLLEKKADVGKMNKKIYDLIKPDLDKKMIILLLKEFLKTKKFFINEKNDKNQSALHLSVLYSFEEITDLLIKNNANILSKNETGKIPFHIACYIGNIKIVTNFLSQKIDLKEEIDDAYSTPFLEAVRNNQKKIIELLIKKGSKFDTKDFDEMNALHICCDLGYEDLTNFFLKKKISPNSKNSFEETPLHLATKKGYTSIIKLLIKNNSEIEAKDEDNSTPLFWAALFGHKTAIKFLLEKKAKINVKDHLHNTPLHCAALFGDISIIELLLKNGAQIDCENLDKETPLHRAVCYGNNQAVRFFFGRKCDFFRVNAKGFDCLEIALLNLKFETVKVLMEFGFDLMKVFENGDCYLQFLARFGRAEAVGFLVGNGLELGFRNLEGETALHVAAKKNDVVFVEVLLQKGADKNVLDNQGKKFDYYLN